MTTAPTVALAAIARPTFDVPLAQSVATAAHAALADAGYAIGGTGAQLIMDADGIAAARARLDAAPYDLLVLLQASFADSSMAVQLASATHACGVPVLLWAVPDARDGGRLRLNSLCGINLAGHALTLAGIRYDYVLAPPDVEGLASALAKIRVLAAAGKALRALRGATIGVAGEHPPGFDTCRYDPAALQDLFGVKVAPLELAGLLAAAAAAPQAKRQEFLQRVRQHAPNLDELDAAATAGTAGVYAALQAEVAGRGLAGLAVRCWPEFFTELGCAACGAMSVLNEDRCPASCEADVNGTLTSLLLQHLGPAPGSEPNAATNHTFITDLVSIDPPTDTGVFWHCGLAPFALADPQTGVRGTVHSNRKLPLLFEFPLRPGRITLARLHRTAAGGYVLAVGGGEMLAAPRPYGGTCGVVRFDDPAALVFDRIMRHGLEHHFSLTYGDCRAELAAVAHFAGLPLLALTGNPPS
jgi:L-fucose isomerase-like protein